jgi:hypothetical protein
MDLICTEVTGSVKGKKGGNSEKGSRNQNKVAQIKSYKSRKGIFQVEAM